VNRLTLLLVILCCRYALMLPTKEMHLDHSMNFMIFQSSQFCGKTVRILLVCKTTYLLVMLVERGSH